MTGHFPAWIFYASNFLCKQRKHPSSEEKQSHHLKKYEAHDSFSDMHIWEKLYAVCKRQKLGKYWACCNLYSTFLIFLYIFLLSNQAGDEGTVRLNL